MANITVNTTELLQLLDITPADHNIMLVGKHGIGKSEILTEYYARKGMPVVALFLGQMASPTKTRKPARPTLCPLTGSLWTASPSCCSWTN